MQEREKRKEVQNDSSTSFSYLEATTMTATRTTNITASKLIFGSSYTTIHWS